MSQSQAIMLDQQGYPAAVAARRLRVLLIQPPEALENLLGKGKLFAQPLPPLGLMYLAAQLRRHGFPVEILDAHFQAMSVEEAAGYALAKRPDLVGISCLTSNGPFVYHLCRRLKKLMPGAKLVLGNHHASFFASFFLRKAGADFVAHGSGEITLVELAQSLEQGDGGFADILGLSWKDGQRVLTNPARPVNRRLDELAFPARDLVPFHLYQDNPHRRCGRNRMALMVSSRGCVNRCRFCCVNEMGKYSLRSAGNVMAEIEKVVKEFGVRFISFADPLFTTNRPRTVELCERLINAQLPLTWWCEGHAAHVDQELLELMRRAGCTAMSYGIESGVQRILDSMGKRTTPDMLRQAVGMTKSAGIEVSGLFILGWLEETERDLEETLAFALSLPLDTAQFAIAVPYPGTALYQTLVQRGEIKLADEDDPRFIEDWFRYSSYISYTQAEPIWLPKGFTSTDLKARQKRLVRRFYLRPRQLWLQIKKLNWSDPVHTLRFLRAARSSVI